jgi:IMP dehydrogenase
MARKIYDVYPYPSRTLQEYLILPNKIQSDMSTSDIDISSPLTKFREGEKPKIKMNAPVLSAAMQAVTGPKMAITMSIIGCAGVIYRSQPIQNQAAMVKEVKDAKAGFVIPDVFSPEDTIEEVQKHIGSRGYSTFPITANGERNGPLVGYLTRKDFHTQKHSQLKVKDRMIALEQVAYAKEDDVKDAEGKLSLEKANEILIESRCGSLPIITNNGNLFRVVFRKDVDEYFKNPNQLVDSRKRYICGAAVGTFDYKERIPILVEAETDFLVIDTAQAYSDYVTDCLKFSKINYPNIPVIAGNIVTGKGFKFLAKGDADSVKIGMGSSMICVTQQQTGVGRGQATALIDVFEERERYYKENKVYIPICADGGIANPGDISIAFALGADYVMLGALLAGTEESNSEKITSSLTVEDRQLQVFSKKYWGEGSIRAKSWMGSRYGQDVYPEGIERHVPYVGPASEHLGKILFQVRDSLKRAGYRSIRDVQLNSEVEAISPNALLEGREKILRV